MSAEGTKRSPAGTEAGENEEQFQEIFSQAPVGIAQTGPDGQWLRVNDRFCEMLGYSKTELPEKTILEMTHPEDREASLTAVRRLLAGEISSWLKEKRYIRKDGGTVWGRLFLSLVRDRTNQPRYLISVVEDITERKLIEERLRASEAQLMEAQRLANVGSWERRIKEDTLYWSDEMLRILGAADGAPSDFAAFLSYVHPKDREKIWEIYARVRLSVAPCEAEYRIIRPNGEARFVRSIVQGIRDDQGELIRITGTTRDLTEQVKARELLRESEEHLKNAARLAHVGYWQWDLQTNRVSGSDEMFRIFGKPTDYTPSYDDFLQTVIAPDRERVAAWVRNCLGEKRGTEIEYQVAWPNGDLRTISCVAELQLGEDGLPARMFGACQDITDFRRAQQENLARQKLESIGTLASGIAHDFNNLLGGVVAQAELALSELAAGLHPEEELRAIRDGALRGSEIVRQLMVYAGKDSATVGLVNVSRIVEEMLQLLKISVSKHAVLETDLGQYLPAVRADAAQLRQIVLNLVTNASEAIGDRDGVIRVSTKWVDGRASEITKGLAEGDYLQLEVSDTGCGMSQETEARVFDPFFTTKSSGHGLGLAVVQGIVRSLGGACHIASEPAKGTIFQVFLPCARIPTDASSDPIPGSGEPVRPSQAITLLVVEDEDPLRLAVVKMLRQTGFEVLEATNGSAAIEILRTHRGKIDGILLDMTIPGASSYEVVDEAAQTRPDATVVLTSAYSEEMLTPPMSTPRICGFIRKPFRLDDLLQKLRICAP
jgi:two-component system cell cycle sensor histidine kinase/response regulator CckA